MPRIQKLPIQSTPDPKFQSPSVNVSSALSLLIRPQTFVVLECTVFTFSGDELHFISKRQYLP
jgi:hypothetical protein